jgi:hypothetical protein
MALEVAAVDTLVAAVAPIQVPRPERQVVAAAEAILFQPAVLSLWRLQRAMALCPSSTPTGALEVAAPNLLGEQFPERGCQMARRFVLVANSLH